MLIFVPLVARKATRKTPRRLHRRGVRLRLRPPADIVFLVMKAVHSSRKLSVKYTDCFHLHRQRQGCVRLLSRVLALPAVSPMHQYNTVDVLTQ